MAEGKEEWTIMVTPEEKKMLRGLLAEIRAHKSAATAVVQANQHFLPQRNQMVSHMNYVRTYYYQYIAQRDLSHKLLMLHYAAIYGAIARHTGLEKGKFWGPEYDRFLTEQCRIMYNGSDNAKGRYRQVGDVYKRLEAGLGTPEQQQTYETCLSNYQKLILDTKHGSWREAVMPINP